MKLTNVACKNAKPKSDDYKLADGAGLYLLVRPGGTRTWKMKFRVDGAERSLTFGNYPHVSLAQARELCQKAKGLLSDGVNPAKMLRPVELTFKALATEWHNGRKATLNLAHWERVLSRLEGDVFPIIGNTEIGKIEVLDILTIARNIEERGSIDTARRVCQTISQVFRFAISKGLAKINPVDNISGALRPKPRVKHRAKIKSDEIISLYNKINTYDGDKITLLALKFTLFTWVRTGETRFAKWSEFEDIDGPDPIWRLSPERMKMYREHIVPLSRQAVLVLNEAKKLSNGVFIFSSNPNLKSMSSNTMLYALYRMGYHSRQTVHGFRGLASTSANESELWSGDWIEMQLAHNEDEVRGAYNSALYLSPRRRMLQWWADLIDPPLKTEDDEFSLLLG